MSFRKFKIYAKLSGIALTFLLAIIFMASNREVVTVKFMGWELLKLPLYLFIICIAGIGILIFIFGKKIIHVVREFGGIRKEEKSRERMIAEVKQQINPEKNG